MLIIQCGNDGEADTLECYVPNVIPRKSCFDVHDAPSCIDHDVGLIFQSPSRTKDDDVGNFSAFMTSVMP